MATKTPNQQAYALISLFEKLYAEKYNRKPDDVNRNRDKWAFISMMDDFGYADSMSIIEYYFQTSHFPHPLNYLLYNYEKLNRIRLEIIEDEKNRLELREKTRARVEEWEKKYGNK